MTPEELSEVIRESADGCMMGFFVQPRASRNAFSGIHAGEVKIALTAPPVDGQANKFLCEFVAKTLKVAKGKVSVRHGISSRHKILEISSLTKEQIITILTEN